MGKLYLFLAGVPAVFAVDSGCCRVVCCEIRINLDINRARGSRNGGDFIKYGRKQSSICMVEQWTFRYIADGPWQQGKPTREHGERGYDLPVTLTNVALSLPAIPFLERTPFPGLEKVPVGQRPQRLIPGRVRDTGDDILDQMSSMDRAHKTY